MSLEIGPHVPRHVAGDPTRLRPILTNLVSNALKFTAKGSVGLRLSSLVSVGDRSSIESAVSDTGIGMTLEQ